MAGAWELLHPKLRSALESLGYREPLPVQDLAIPVVLSGYNTLIVAPTGSGKTEAAVLPLVSKMLARQGAGLRLVYVTPLRALNRDVVVRISRIAGAVGLRAAVRHGDTPPAERRRFLSDPPDIMVTTPESLSLLLASTYDRPVWESVRYVVVDEVHELLESERGSELAVTLERLERRAGRPLQRVGLSATLSRRSTEWAARLLGGGRLVRVVEYRGEKKYEISVDVVGGEWDEGTWRRLAERVAALALAEKGSVLVFVNTRSTAEKLARELAEILGEGRVAVHHGSLSRRVREEAERLFREGKLKVLVATSSMELGIDIGHVGLVIQFLSPRQALAMVQRAGRAGHRLTQTSRAVIVTIGNLFEALESGVIAYRAERGKIEDVEPHRKPFDALAHQLAAMAVEGSAATVDEAYELVSATLPFEGIEPGEVVEVARHLSTVRKLRIREDGRLAPARETYRYLYKVSMIPDEVTYTVESIVDGSRIGEVSERFVESITMDEEAGGGQVRRRPVFTLAGRIWEMLDVDLERSRVIVKPVGEAEGRVPLWEGELIPVDYKVAREVCGLLTILMEEGEDRHGLLAARKLGDGVAERILDVLRGTREAWGGPHLSPATPVVEVVGDTAILYVCLGSKGNFALAVLLSKLLERRVGSVVFNYIPYAIVFKGVGAAGRLGEAIRGALLEAKRLSPVERASIIYSAVKRTKGFKLRFVQVAKRMGVVDPDARLTGSMVESLARAYEGSVVERETLREVIHDKLDLRALNEFLEGLRDVKVVVLEEPSPLAKEVASNPYLRRDRATHLKAIALELLIKSKKRSLARRRVLLLCVMCGHAWEKPVSEIGGLGSVRCPRCGRLTVAPLPPGDWGRRAVEVVRKALRGGRLSREEKKIYKEVMDRMALMANYAEQGLARRVAEALSARGVGPATAKRILRNYMISGDEERFYKDIMDAEEKYAANRRYWRT